jgi:ABC-2 type transport system permease protein
VTPVNQATLPIISTGDFLSAEDESSAFWLLRWRIGRTRFKQIVTETRFRAALVLVLSVLLWCGLLLMFLEGFGFLRTSIPHPETHDEMVRGVFGMFFAALMVMLMFSAGIILYGLLFHSPETAYLLSIPARTERVFLHKFQDAVFLSSWGFILLGSPVILAYGVVADAPWYYYLMMLPFILSFVYIPAGIGSIICLLIIYIMPGKRRLILFFIGGGLLLAAYWLIWSLLRGPESNLLTPNWFQEMLGRLQFTERRLLPSWWLSSGLLDAARDDWPESVMFLVLLFSNALFFRQLSIFAAGCVYRKAYSAFFSTGRKSRRGRSSLLDRTMSALTCFFPAPMRLLMVKDLRLFRRDPMQWSQFLIFFGLLTLYFFNVRRFNYDLYYIGWVNMVSFLNVSVVGLLMSTFTTRFIYPLLSLEGQRFWLLGLLPVRRQTILWSKFLFAAGTAIVPCSLLILLSDLMLDISLVVMASHQLTCLILCFGLAGIAVGLGARLPNLREPSPSRIAAGFGGTLCLVISTLYILIVVLLTALPTHFVIAAKSTTTGQAMLENEVNLVYWLNLWLLGGTAASIGLGILATVVPLRMGFRFFKRMEF